MRLTDRHGERGMLDQLTNAVRAGGSRVLVVRGEPGVGKSALLDYLAGHALGCRVVRAAGVESEMELAFAGLHQLLAPVLDRLERLPGPQREALRTAFGLSAGPVPDRFLVGLAVLGLVSEVAGEQPLVCVVDDEQWLDRASVQALGFVARRLAADPVGLVFAARVPGAELAGLPELAVEGLREEDARALLDSVLAGPVDARVRDLIVAETRGNPLALLELPRGLAAAELAGGFGLPAAVSLPGRIEESFQRQLEGLPEETRRLLLVAAADPSGDPLLVWRATGRLGIAAQAGAPAVGAGLVEFGVRVRFRHPLARSAAYRSAPVQQMQEVHAALAEATDPVADPDRRSWHRAQAAAGPDEEVAAELERSAGRAQARGARSQWTPRSSRSSATSAAWMSLSTTPATWFSVLPRHSPLSRSRRSTTPMCCPPSASTAPRCRTCAPSATGCSSGSAPAAAEAAPRPTSPRTSPPRPPRTPWPSATRPSWPGSASTPPSSCPARSPPVPTTTLTPGTPADTAVEQQYDQLYAGIMDEIPARQARMAPPGADPAEVARQITRVVGLPKGQRPFRVHIDPMHDGAEEVFNLGDRIRSRVLPAHRLRRPAHTRQQLDSHEGRA